MLWGLKVSTVIMILSLGLYPSTAYAYLDPGAGSMFLQALLAAFFGASFFFRNTWAKLFTRKKESNSSLPPAETMDSDGAEDSNARS